MTESLRAEAVFAGKDSGDAATSDLAGREGEAAGRSRAHRKRAGSRPRASRATPSSRRCCRVPTAASPASCSAWATGRRASRAGRPSCCSVNSPRRCRQARTACSRRRAIRRSPPWRGASAPIASFATRAPHASEPPRLRIPDGADREHVLSTVEAVWQGRSLINTPASDLGPAELADAVRALAARYGAAHHRHRRRRPAESQFPHDPRGRARKLARARASST